MAICRDCGSGDCLRFDSGVPLRRYIAACNGRENALGPGLDHTIRSDTADACCLLCTGGKGVCRNDGNGIVRDRSADKAERGNGGFRGCNDRHGTPCDGSTDNVERSNGTACNASSRDGTHNGTRNGTRNRACNDAGNRAADRTTRAAMHDLYLLRNRPFAYG